MAKITPSLSIVANSNTHATIADAGLSSDAISFTISDALTVANPSAGLSRRVIADSTSSTLVDATLGAAAGYVYIQFVSSENATDDINVTIEDANPVQLQVGEFMFMPTGAARTIIAASSGGTAVVEFAFWTRG
tara:strand:- start:55 stop:456 length:402 start_codon:yes stop_codon:yes gene_type:complete